MKHYAWLFKAAALYALALALLAWLLCGCAAPEKQYINCYLVINGPRVNDEEQVDPRMRRYYDVSD